MSALILGTLLNYLVTKDLVTEAHKKRLEELSLFADAKQLPGELRERMFKYLVRSYATSGTDVQYGATPRLVLTCSTVLPEFQHRKNVQNKAAASMDLPQNLQIKVADSKVSCTYHRAKSKTKRALFSALCTGNAAFQL
eukprot:2837678-Rhodomonas_salina.1